MGNKDDLTIYNISDNLKERLQGGFRWNLTDELSKRLESGEKNTKDLLAVNEWLKEELDTIVSSRNARNFDPSSVKLAKSILDLIYLRSVFDLDSQQIFIYTAPYVQDRTYKLLKGSEVNNKSNFTLDVCMSFEYYKCNNSTPNIVEDCINSKIIRFSNLFTNFCKFKGINCDLKPLRNNSDCDVTVYGRIGSEAEGPIDQLNVTLQGGLNVDYGLKVQLQNLHSIDEFFLFPGQMAAVTGLFFEDNFGMKYLASEIRSFITRLIVNSGSGAPVDKPFVTLISQNKFMDENMHIICVKGSLLTEALKQTSFSNIFQVIKRDKPHVVIFTGPFISINQISAEGYGLSSLGDITLLYSKFLNDLSNVAQVCHRDLLTVGDFAFPSGNLFSHSIHTFGVNYILITQFIHSTRYFQIGAMKNTNFIIVPHPYDVILGYPLPQPPLNCKSTTLHNKQFPPNVLFLSNPAHFRLNGILFAITSCDPLSFIYKNMVYKGIDDPLKRVCKELLLQRSFFPGYPVSKVPAEYAVDLTKLRELEFSKNLVPDVLLFCSEVKTEPFIQFTNQRAFVSLHNNSVSIKETSVESYTEIYITPLGNKDEDEPVQELDIENRITLVYSTIK